MAGVSETRIQNDVLSTTLANYRNKLVDKIFDNYPLLSYLNGKLGVGLRGKSVKRLVSGGESIVEQLMYEDNSTAGSYAGAEVLDTTLQDGITIARYDWKQYSASIGITGKDKLSNAGSTERLINLLEAKTKQAEMSLRKELSEGAWSDGTGNGSKDLTGLQTLVDSGTTVGGLAPGTYAWWASNENSTATSFAADGLATMRTSFNSVSYGNDKPDIVFTDQNNYERYEAALQPQERYQNTEAANSGFTALTFKGIPIMWDRDCPSNEMYFLNSNYLSFVVHDQADMTTGEFVTPNNQDLSTAQILFMGNTTVSNRRMFAKITAFTD